VDTNPNASSEATKLTGKPAANDSAAVAEVVQVLLLGQGWDGGDGTAANEKEALDDEEVDERPDRDREVAPGERCVLVLVLVLVRRLDDINRFDDLLLLGGGGGVRKVVVEGCGEVGPWDSFLDVAAGECNAMPTPSCK